MPLSARAQMRLCVLFGVALASSSSGGFAATVRYQTDAELLAASSRVIRGRVIGSRGQQDGTGRIYTVTTVEVLEDFSGYRDPIVEIRELGGRAGTDFLYVGGAAEYVPGSEILVCLERASGGWLRSVSMGFSKFDVVPTSDGDPVLHRNLADIVVAGVAGNAQAVSARRLSSFRQLAERVRGVRSVRPMRVEALPLAPAATVDAFTWIDFGGGQGARWIEADSGTPVRWYIDTSAPPPVPGDAVPELRIALAGWTDPPQASIVLTHAGFTDQTPSGGPWWSVGSAGVVFFDDPEDDIGDGVLAIGGGWGTDTDDGGVASGRAWKRFLSAFVIFQNSAQLSSNFHQSRDFTRVLLHEVGHGIGLGHTATPGNIMVATCCDGSTPVAPAIGSDDLAGVAFMYPPAAQCSYTVSPSSMSVPSSANSVNVQVSTQEGCTWNMSGVPPWISPNVSSGTGSGSIQLLIAANANASQRSATILIAGRPLAISQQGCQCTVSPTSLSIAAGGSAATVSVSSSGCEWSASSAVPWIAVTAGTNGIGNGTVRLEIQRNSGSVRTAAVTVAGRTVTVTQGDGTRPVAADFNGDGWSDLVWHHQGDGRISVWHMNGISLASGTLLTPDRVADTSWKVVGVWDPDRDGHPDLLWHHQGNGSLATWKLRGTTLVSGQAITPAAVTDTAWQIVAIADMDGDGDGDLIWQHRTQGLVSTWLMNGTTMVEGRLLSPSRVSDTNWKIAGSGDFDADGHADLLWQHQLTGQVSVWFMNRTTQARGTLLSPPGVSDTTWQIRGITDLNGDGHPDLVWQNVSSGYLSAWLMRGLTRVDGVYLSPAVVADTNWRLAGPR